MNLNLDIYSESFKAFQLYHDEFKRIPRKLKKLIKKVYNEPAKIAMCMYLQDKYSKN